MKKVLLIFPPYSLEEEFAGLSAVGNMQPPLGIGYIGAVLEKAGFEVKIIDAPPLGWGQKKIVAEAKDWAPDYIGLSVSTVDFPKSVKLARTLKKVLAIPIIIGGPHVTALPEEVLAYTCFDVGVLGEGEVTIVELIRSLAAGRRLSSVKGIAFREKGKVIKTLPRPFIDDLDGLPLPARHLMPKLSLYHPTPATYKKLPVGSMITSRGCPNRCSFCFRGVFGHRWRFRSPLEVVGEMESLLDNFGAQEIRIWDDTFNADIDRVKEICRLIIKRGLRFSWTCLGRVNRADKKMFELMKKAGCWQISYGIESGNDLILASLQKGITKTMVKKAIELTYQTGIQSLGFFILGLPGETEATMRETIDFAKSLPLSAANFSLATPYPGTDLWFLARKAGFLTKVAYDKLVVNLPPKPTFVPDGLSGERLLAYEKMAYREFYRRPKFLFRQLGQIQSLPELVRKMKAFWTIERI